MFALAPKPDASHHSLPKPSSKMSSMPSSQCSRLALDDSPIRSLGHSEDGFDHDSMIGITASERLRMQNWLDLQRKNLDSSSLKTSASTEVPSDPLFFAPFEPTHLARPSSESSSVITSTSALHQATPEISVPTRLALCETLMGCIDTFQSGAANDATYLSAANALRDLHAFVSTAEKKQRASVQITIDGEEFIMKDFHNASVVIRLSDNSVFDLEGRHLGTLNDSTGSIELISDTS